MDEKTKSKIQTLQGKMNILGDQMRKAARDYYTKNPQITFKKGKGTVEGEVLDVNGEGGECKLKVKNAKTGKEYSVNLFTLFENGDE